MLNFGGIILQPDGGIERDWQGRMHALMTAALPGLRDLASRIDAWAETTGYAGRTRMVEDAGTPFFIVVKDPDKVTANLETIEREVVRPWIADGHGDYCVHRNGNNLAILPTSLDKANAVAYVTERLRREHGEIITFGMGDSPLGRALHGRLRLRHHPAPHPTVALDGGDAVTLRSGSYLDGDVDFLLKRLPLADFVDVAEKEALIQSGRRHYSEMLSPERAPSARYLALFDEACRVNGERMARDCLRLAALIAAAPQRPRDAGLAGARRHAGRRRPQAPAAQSVFERAATHYSVSIVRDRGIDANALRHILAQGHAPESIVFVDGWTGKGVIARELADSIARFNAAHGVALDAGLHVLADLAGAAAVAASCDDYLIPSSILNATVSGLISRSVLNEAIGPDDFHGCVLYDALAAQDRSRSFVDTLERLALAQTGAPAAGGRHAGRGGALAGLYRRKRNAALRHR